MQRGLFCVVPQSFFFFKLSLTKNTQNNNESHVNRYLVERKWSFPTLSSSFSFSVCLYKMTRSIHVDTREIPE